MERLHRVALLAAGFWFACSPTTLLAEAAGLPASDARVQAAVAEASKLGEQLYRYDQAAWHATDRMVQRLDEAIIPLMRGYIVDQGAGDLLETVFFGEIDGTLVEMARYSVDGDRVVAGDWLPADGRPALSDRLLKLVAARQAAINYAGNQQLRLCSEASPNTIVLPPDGLGAIATYILTPPVAEGAYPMGGHYRIEVDSNGAVAQARNYMNTCMDAEYASPEADAEPVSVVVSHLLDDHPTEIHALVSRYIPVPIFVVTTGNKTVWGVADGTIVYVEQIED